MITLYTGGTFDLFHSGHVKFLSNCRSLVGESGRVVVSLNTDDFVATYKGSPPICSFMERKEVLESVRYVDEVIENVGGADSKVAIVSVSPQVIAIGSDWALRDYCSQMGFTQVWLDEMQIKLVYLPYTDSISSSEIKRRMGWNE